MVQGVWQVPELQEFIMNIWNIFSQENFCPAPVHLVNPEQTLLLNLQQTEEEILAQMKKSTRYEVRRIEKLGIKVLVFSDQSRLSRDIIVQESSYRLLSSRGYSLISSENPNSFLEDTPTSNLIRQILGSFCEFDRSSTVNKLRVSRIRKRESNREKGIVTRNRTGKCEGRLRCLEIHPELESLILKLRKKGFSLRKISNLLKDEYGYKVSFVSVGNILKDIEWMKKERRRLKRIETV